MHNLLDKPRDTCAWIITGTDTFRLGSRKLLARRQLLEGYNIGANRQNVEKSLRQNWEADSGYLLCQTDQAGAEALVVSYLTRNAKYRSLFLNGIKPHNYLALKLFKEVWSKHFGEGVIAKLISLPIPQLRSDPDWAVVSEMIKDSDNWKPIERYYHFAKKTIHAGSYGMRENTFRLQMLKESGGIINLTLEQASLFLMGFHQEFPEIREWHARVYDQAQSTKQLRNLFGFPYNITNKIREGDIKDLISWVPQSTVACITRQAFVRFYEYCEEHKKQWHLLNDCHDSYMAEAPKEEILECAKVMKSFMEIELKSPYDGSVFRMKSAASIGKNWNSYKKGINEKGLVETKI